MSSTDFDIRGWLGAVLTHLHLNPGLDGVGNISTSAREVQLSCHNSRESDMAVLLERWMFSLAAVEHVQIETYGSATEFRLIVVGELVTGVSAEVWIVYRGEHPQALLAAAEDGRLDIGVFSHIAAGKGDPTARPAARVEDQSSPVVAPEVSE